MTCAPPNYRRHSTVRTYESERSEPLLLIRTSMLWLRALTLQCAARAILRPEYMTRSTRINWHYGYDVVSLITVIRPLVPPADLLAPRGALVSRANAAPRVFNTTVMHRDKPALALASLFQPRGARNDLLQAHCFPFLFPS